MVDLDNLGEPSAPAKPNGLKKRTAKPTTPQINVKVSVDTSNEVLLIAAVIGDERFRKRYLSAISPDYFLGPGHAPMWVALQELYRRKLDYSTETIRSIAGEAFDTLVLEGYRSEHEGVLVNAGFHIERLKWDHARASSVPLLGAFVEALRDPTAAPEKVRGHAERLAKAFSGHGDLRYLRTVPAVVASHRAEMTARRNGRAIYPYGIAGLDHYGSGDTVDMNGKARMIPGCHPGQLTLIAGRHGGGKTTATARIVLAQALAGRRVLWGAWEGGVGMSLELLAAMALGWSRSDFMTGNYTEEDQLEHEKQMMEFEDTIQFLELPFDRAIGAKIDRDTNSRNLDTLHQYISDSGCEVFVCDLFRRVLQQTRLEDEEQALWRIQAIAQETRTHGILLNQLNKGGIDSEAPKGTDSKGTGEWMAVVDTYLLLHLPHQYTDHNDTMMIQVEKQRWGVYPQAVECDWDGEFGSITNGRTVPYKAAGPVSEIDGFLDETVMGRGRGKGKGRR